MFAEILFAVVVAEGIHDSRAVAKFLELKGYREGKKCSQIPEQLQPVIPRKYPWRSGGDELSWIVPHPSFFYKENHWILVSNANGESNLGRDLTENLIALRGQFLRQSLVAVAVIADADTKAVPEKYDGIDSRIHRCFSAREDLIFDPKKPNEIVVNGKRIPLYKYIFPNNNDKGTLERLIIDGGKTAYPDLLARAEDYVSYAKTRAVCADTLKNFNEDKATVGIVSNMLRPGKANQVSIHDDEWISETSILEVSSHSSFSAFLDVIVSKLNGS